MAQWRHPEGRAIYLTYRAFQFPRDSCDVSRTGRAVKTDAGIPVAFDWSWAVTCYLRSAATDPAARQADFAAQEAAVRAALSAPFGNLTLWTDGGVPAVALLNTPDCLDGVKVELFETPGGQQEFAANRTVRFTARATYLLPGTGALLMSFEERLSATGTGGPQVRNRPTLDGLGVRQQVYPRTVCRARQTGRAVGWLQYPDVPPPLWPGDEQPDQRQDDKASPHRQVNGLTRYERSWVYAFERIGDPFIGTPNIQP